MAVFTNDENLSSVLLWDAALCQNDKKEMRMLPFKYTDLAEQIYVNRVARVNSDPLRTGILYFKGAEEGNTATVKREATFHVRGFVSSFKLELTGNWNHNIPGCAKAVQYLSIGPGQHGGSDGNAVAFRTQQTGLENVRKYICRKLGLPFDYHDTANKTLYFSHRVFTKKEGDLAQMPLIEGDQIYADTLVKANQKGWIICSAVPISRIAVDGSVHASDHSVIEKGDFVEAVVFADITSQQRESARVRFGLKSVVLLKSMGDTNGQEEAASNEHRDSSDAQTEPPSKRRRSGIQTVDAGKTTDTDQPIASTSSADPEAGGASESMMALDRE
ncbi:hypothetical protein EIP91_009599 [Steccherinum ochraceum]|uniref:Uncharacterized protein n=1 Tax=Steccherinum ochraceum TaxID=92696 RepID=A0A4R0R3Q9_9APHY|nr:hypothetical protein EIP91_009599 [Steccherinum ochraceum]